MIKTLKRKPKPNSKKIYSPLSNSQNGGRLNNKLSKKKDKKIKKKKIKRTRALKKITEKIKKNGDYLNTTPGFEFNTFQNLAARYFRATKELDSSITCTLKEKMQLFNKRFNDDSNQNNSEKIKENKILKFAIDALQKPLLSSTDLSKVKNWNKLAKDEQEILKKITFTNKNQKNKEIIEKFKLRSEYNYIENSEKEIDEIPLILNPQNTRNIIDENHYSDKMIRFIEFYLKFNKNKKEEEKKINENKCDINFNEKFLSTFLGQFNFFSKQLENPNKQLVKKNIIISQLNKPELKE